MLINSITEAIGKTPILRIDNHIHGLKNIDLYAKLEYLNPFGSLKDRTAFGLLREEIEEIKKKELAVIETSSGNTAKALQCICNIHGIQFWTITNRIRVSESKNILQYIGTHVVEVSRDVNTISRIEEIVAANPDKYFHTAQYSNINNVKAHYETGREIFEDAGRIDYYFSVLGTSGSGRGVTMYLKEKNPELISVGVVSSDDSYIPGIRSLAEMVEGGFYERDFYNSVETVSINEAKYYMKRLCSELGILAGVSSGAVFAGALTYLNQVDRDLETMNKRASAAFIICDRLETYANYVKENRFYKYHVLGNTYILIDPGENPIKLNQETIKGICNIDYGVGADGIIYGPFVKNEEYAYKAYNRDGSEVKSALFASMIFAKYLRDKETARERSVRIAIGNQNMTATFLNGESTRVRVNTQLPVNTGTKVFFGRKFTCINVGNDNIVGDESNLSRSRISEVAESIIKTGAYPDGINIQLVRIIGGNSLHLESFERGVGYTLASGTSIMAACFAKKEELGITPGGSGDIVVHTAGGVCNVSICDTECSITADVYKIYEGEYPVD